MLQCISYCDLISFGVLYIQDRNLLVICWVVIRRHDCSNTSFRIASNIDKMYFNYQFIVIQTHMIIFLCLRTVIIVPVPHARLVAVSELRKRRYHARVTDAWAPLWAVSNRPAMLLCAFTLVQYDLKQDIHDARNQQVSQAAAAAESLRLQPRRHCPAMHRTIAAKTFKRASYFGQVPNLPYNKL